MWTAVDEARGFVELGATLVLIGGGVLTSDVVDRRMGPDVGCVPMIALSFFTVGLVALLPVVLDRVGDLMDSAAAVVGEDMAGGGTVIDLFSLSCSASINSFSSCSSVLRAKAINSSRLLG